MKEVALFLIVATVFLIWGFLKGWGYL